MTAYSMPIASAFMTMGSTLQAVHDRGAHILGFEQPIEDALRLQRRGEGHRGEQQERREQHDAEVVGDLAQHAARPG